MNPPEAISVLDHGLVRLVASMGDDLSVVRSARVSYDAAWRAGENEASDHKLIHYLWKNHHTTPFESVELQFEIKAPIFVLRQWHRHRTWSYNELSARYRPLPEEFYIPKAEVIGVQAVKNKQGRDLPQDEDILAGRREELFWYTSACQNAFARYNQLLTCGWPRELARAVLPVSTYSHMFAKVNLKNFFAFLALRLDSHAQYEIRVYAEAMLTLVRDVAPVSVAAWEAAKGEKV